MQERRNYYRILQAQPDAPAQVIRSNYRTLLQKLRVHPDLGGSNRDATTLNLAYQTLGDPARRAAYDRELLARYSVRTLGQGGMGALPTPASEHEVTDNRRNHYRILQVQRDASPAIIQASFSTLSANASSGALSGLQAAYDVLSNPDRRRAYDEAMNDGSWVSGDRRSVRAGVPEGADEPPAQEYASPATYQPLIERYCAFCKTPHGQLRSDAADESTCIECDSALTCAFAPNAPSSGRDALRLEWDSRVNLRLEWPGPVVKGTLRDFSAQGALVQMREHVAVGEVVRLECDRVSAVSRVVHAHMPADGASRCIGLQFLTARFMRPQGTFVSAQV